MPMTGTIKSIVSAARFTIFLGKNGSGKSTLLRGLDSAGDFSTKYISPERGGTLKYDPNVDNNMTTNANWMIQDRRKNRTEQFRQQSSAQFRNLEVLVLREIEQDSTKRRDSSYTFNNTLAKINGLLPAIELRRSDRGFKICSKQGADISEDQVSSGEAELIALAIEVLVFSRDSSNNRLLLLDEPDVHLHPDLQQRFVEFVEAAAVEFDFKVALATHSSAIIGAFSKSSSVQIVPITSRNQTDFATFNYSPICHEILPIFGAHPLSGQFNRSPVLLLEGEDDKRVIDQIVRSSNRGILFSPCVVGSVSEMSKWEEWLAQFLPSLYDNPRAYSLRDLDESQQTQMNDIGCVWRVRLNCYAIENLLLTDECLAAYGHTAESFRKSIQDWAAQRPAHQATQGLKLLAERFEDRRLIKIKEVRNVLVALLGTEKPWEVLVGQVVAKNLETPNESKNSIHEYLGDDVMLRMFGVRA
jgi:predicted ATPase